MIPLGWRLALLVGTIVGQLWDIGTTVWFLSKGGEESNRLALWLRARTSHWIPGHPEVPWLVVFSLWKLVAYSWFTWKLLGATDGPAWLRAGVVVVGIVYYAWVGWENIQRTRLQALVDAHNARHRPHP